VVRGKRDHCFRMFSLKHTSKIRQNFYAGREEGLEKKNQGIDMMICKKRTAAVSRIIFFSEETYRGCTKCPPQNIPGSCPALHQE